MPGALIPGYFQHEPKEGKSERKDRMASTSKCILANNINPDCHPMSCTLVIGLSVICRQHPFFLASSPFYLPLQAILHLSYHATQHNPTYHFPSDETSRYPATIGHLQLHFHFLNARGVSDDQCPVSGYRGLLVSESHGSLYVVQ
jgi:hypothetical protein